MFSLLLVTSCIRYDHRFFSTSFSRSSAIFCGVFAFRSISLSDRGSYPSSCQLHKCMVLHISSGNVIFGTCFSVVVSLYFVRMADGSFIGWVFKRTII